MIYGHDSYACFAFYFLPPSFSCIITHIICWHKGSVENFKAAHRLHRSFITASHYSCVKKNRRKMSHLFIFVKGGRTNVSLWNIYSRDEIWVPGSSGTLRRICCAVFFSHPKRRWQVLAFHFQSLDSQRSPTEIGSSHFTASTDSCSKQKQKKEEKQKRTKPQTKSVTAYLSRTTFRIDVFVISLFQK